MAVIVRAGGPADHDAAVAVWLTANTARRGGEPVAAQHELRVRGYADKPDAFLVVADDAGEVTGMALAMQACADDGAGPPVSGLCHIAMVFVAPDRWGEGVGGQLVDAVLAEARDRGYDRAQLWTHVDNGRGQRLYDGRGFRRSGREKDDDLGERVVHYERQL